MSNYWKLVTACLAISFTIVPFSAEGGSLSTPVLNSVVINDDAIQVTLNWSTVPSSQENDLDDYGYTTDGWNFTPLLGNFSSSQESESHTLTLSLPRRANATWQTFGIAMIRDNQVIARSNFIKAKISEFPVPVHVKFSRANDSFIEYRIQNYNSAAISNNSIRYKILHVRKDETSKISITLEGDLIRIINYRYGERLSFKVMKYVLACEGFSPYLSCPYNAKANVDVDWKQVVFTNSGGK